MVTFTEPCILVQDDNLSQPLILLRRDDGAEVEVLTIEKAHAIVDEHIFTHSFLGPDSAPDWWMALTDLLQGIR